MKVHFLTSDALMTLKSNVKVNMKNYTNENNQWIYDYFGKEKCFLEYKTEFPKFELNYNEEENIGTIDVNNTIALYNSMRSLTDAQATDERLWSGMCHCDFWDYLKKRWNENKTHEKSENEKLIKNRFFFGQYQKRSLITNSLAKLWWVGRLTYDESRPDPFELTKYLSSDYATKTLVIFSNNYMGNKTIAIGLISALKELDDEEFKIDGMTYRDLYTKATKYLNVLGGTYVLDYFSSEEIKEKIIKYIKSLKK